LAEVDRDLARGVIAPDEAARLRTEVSRRLLDADRTAEAALPARASGRFLLPAALIAPVL
jgi:cytochrome c-type biogenesis protein CcmH